ncbi:MAG TPA: hypothetical protein VFY14_01405, partial [Streptomyces sp.]|nr:hypothetical protein [Streptomyces sp.]
MTKSLTAGRPAPSRGSGAPRPAGSSGPSGAPGSSGLPGRPRSRRPWRTSALPAWWPPVLGLLLG